MKTFIKTITLPVIAACLGLVAFAGGGLAQTSDAMKRDTMKTDAMQKDFMNTAATEKDPMKKQTMSADCSKMGAMPADPMTKNSMGPGSMATPMKK
jgi:pentapeptide MXKDX repeat protein